MSARFFEDEGIGWVVTVEDAGRRQYPGPTSVAYGYQDQHSTFYYP